MSAHKSIDKICIIVLAVTVALGAVFCCGSALGIETKASAAGYESRLFDHSRVHTIDIVMNDWDGFIEGCESEEYTACNLVIDGEAVKNVGIRAKGNTSLSSVKNMDSDRYSFKIEFDQYENGKSYYGLDKLCLNNVIQDNTYMKDYLAYTLMNDFGVDSPLCSYAYITVNGEDWGLYLAVEAIENSFLDRNYGSNYGNLYKPDSMSFGGGRGNGRDFSMSDFMNKNSDDDDDEEDDESDEDSDKDAAENEGTMPDFGSGMPDMGEGFDPSNMPDMSGFDGNMPDFGGEMPTFGDGEMPSMPDGFDPSQMFGGNTDSTEAGESSDGKPSGKGSGFGGLGGFGMCSDDVKLKYIDDDIDSYSNIFNNMKTNGDTAAKKRLISSLKSLSEQTDLENVLDTEEVIRYFVVHNFLCNGDSYTGQMIHNYYLYEEDGQMHMIPWDYNLAYGSFQGGSASSSVNSPIDTPVSGGMSDRPMVSWIFDNEEYIEQYHQLFSEFLNSVDLHALITETAELIDEYVEKDPTKFCTYEEFKTGVEAIDTFCTLRAQSVEGQLNGTIPSTSDGQSADSSALIDTGDLSTSDMGSMGSGGGFGGGPGGGGNPFGKSKDSENSDDNTVPETTDSETDETVTTGSFKKMLQFTYETEESGTLSAVAMDSKKPSGGFSGGDRPSFGDGNMPDDFDPSQFDGKMPEGFDPSQFGDGEMPDFGGEKPSGSGNKKPDGDNADEVQAPTEETNEDADTGSEEKITLKINDTPAETTTTVTSGSTDDKSKGSPDKSKGDSKGSRPSMGGGSGFPGMGGAAQADDTTAYVLIAISAGVLLIGLIIAKLLKR